MSWHIKEYLMWADIWLCARKLLTFTPSLLYLLVKGVRARGQHNTMNNDYTVIRGLEESRVSWELEKKYLKEKVQAVMDEIKLPALAFLVIMTGFIAMQTHAIAEMASNQVYFLN